MDPLHDTNRKIARGAAWMVSFKLIDRAIGLATTIVLARLLVPADFGVVAMAMVVIGAVELLGAFSFDMSLIHQPTAPRENYDTAWTLTLIVALFSGVCLGALAQPASAFFHEPRLEAVMYVLAVASTLQGFENIGMVALRREFRFDRDFKFLLGKRLASILVTIPLAITLRSYWALVLGQLAGKILSVALSYRMSDYRPRFSLVAKDRLLHFSKWMLATHTIAFLHRKLADFVIARMAGAGALGIYSVSYEVSNLPTTELVAPINRAAYPGYSRLAADLAKLRSSFLEVISMIALFALPAGLGIVVTADLVVPVALGWKWVEAIPLMQVLALYGVIVAVQTNINYVYMAVGRPGVITAITGAEFVVQTGLLIPATLQYGAIGAGWAMLATAIVMLPVNQILIARQLHISPRAFCARLVRPFIATLLMVAAVWGVKLALATPQQTLAYLGALVLCLCVGVAVYVVVLYQLWVMAGRPDGPERHCLEQIRPRLRRAKC